MCAHTSSNIYVPTLVHIYVLTVQSIVWEHIAYSVRTYIE